MKFKEFFSKKWVIASTATVVTLGVAAAVATPIALFIKDAGEKAVRDLGVTIDKSTTSALDDGTFKADIPASELTDEQKTEGITKRKLNIVALGDSITAGYTSLTSQASTAATPGVALGKRPGDNISYADYVAKMLKDEKRLGTYANWAKSGATASDVMSVITKRANYEQLRKADVVFLTIGANDLLRGFNMLGFPYNTLSELLGGAAATADSASRTSLGIVSPSAPLTDQLKLALPVIMNIINNKPEVTFGVDKDAILNALKNASGEILRIISNVHAAAPKAEIIFNEYNFPFNRWVHNGKNITDYEDKMWTDLGFGTNTLRSTYNYVLGQIKEKVLENYRAAKWFSFQDAQDSIIADQVKRGILPSVEEGQRLFQMDLADIHPTEYAHALMAQKMYNDLFADRIATQKLSSDFPEVKARILSADPQPISDLFLFFLNNTGAADKDNSYIANLFNTAALGRPFQAMLGTVFMFFDRVQMNSQTYRTLVTEQLQKATSAFINTTIFGVSTDAPFGTATPLYTDFVASGTFYPYPSLVSTGSLYSIFDIVQKIVAESAIAHVDQTYSTLSKVIFALPEASRTQFFTALGVTATPVPATEVAVLAALRTYFEGLTALPTASPLASTVPAKAQFDLALEELRRSLTYAAKLAEVFPGLLKDKAAQTKQVTWANMRRNNKGVFAQIA